MKHFFNKFSLGFLTLSVSVLALVFIQQQVIAAWEAPSVSPGDQTGVNTPLIANESGDVDLETNDIINVGNLETDTLTANTFNTNSLDVSNLTIPLGAVQGTVDIIAENSSMQLTATNSAMGSATKAAYFMTGSSATGGASYGLYASTNALSAANSNYAVAGVSNNAGGTAVYGLANSGWAGYFSGPVGVAGSLAVGNNSTANGLYSFASGHSAAADGDYAVALGTLTVSGADSVGINLDDTAGVFNLSQANSMAIMGGNVGINTLTPSSKLHLVGSYYQDGMMQVRPTTALAASENIIYANLPSGSNASSNVILLQNNGSNRFRVTAGGVGSFASGVSATYANFSGALTVTGATTLNGGATAAGSLSMKTGGYMSFSGSAGSYFDFNDDSGTAEPSCAAGTAGVVYNFKVHNVLCYCDGSSWFSMVNGKADSLCADK
ncbi:hypothetical protein KBC40_00675 [Patescibacteria group bacterium]|nr:hypothetical protein [Patescibacteria group bacterium]